jgi:chemotaxis protein MotB
MRRKKHPEHANHERWLVSYADFITLLFAFFVVMFASSQTDRNKTKQLSEAVKEAFEKGHLPTAVYSILGGSTEDKGRGGASKHPPTPLTHKAPLKPDQQAVELAPSLKQLNEDLREEIRKGRLEVSLEPRGLVVSLKEAAFFPSGGEQVKPESLGALEKVAGVIRKLPNPVSLEGHTDSVPIHNSRFRNNWELSAARSIAMLELFEARFGVRRDQMAVAGYADLFPVGDNGTDEGRAQNRRVDILIMNERGAMAMPQRRSEPGHPEKAPSSSGQAPAPAQAPTASHRSQPASSGSLGGSASAQIPAPSARALAGPVVPIARPSPFSGATTARR